MAATIIFIGQPSQSCQRLDLPHIVIRNGFPNTMVIFYAQELFFFEHLNNLPSRPNSLTTSAPPPPTVPSVTRAAVCSHLPLESLPMLFFCYWQVYKTGTPYHNIRSMSVFIVRDITRSSRSVWPRSDLFQHCSLFHVNSKHFFYFDQTSYEKWCTETNSDSITR